MPITLKRGFRDLLREANEQVEELSVAKVAEALADPSVTVLDVRDQHELEQSGTLPGAQHASRGMLEFYADPDSPMHRPAITDAARLILYCGTSGRSALAARTLKDMGYEQVAHMAGGIKAWIESGRLTEPFMPQDPGA